MLEGSDHTIYRNPCTGVLINRVIVADALDAEIAKLPESILKKTRTQQPRRQSRWSTASSNSESRTPGPVSQLMAVKMMVGHGPKASTPLSRSAPVMARR